MRAKVTLPLHFTEIVLIHMSILRHFFCHRQVVLA